jgi:hypothetical protein
VGEGVIRGSSGIRVGVGWERKWESEREWTGRVNESVMRSGRVWIVSVWSGSGSWSGSRNGS